MFDRQITQEIVLFYGYDNIVFFIKNACEEFVRFKDMHILYQKDKKWVKNYAQI